MNPEIKGRWIERLRSGEYTQGTDALNNHGLFCCLGVLMEIAVEDGICTGEAVSSDEIGYLDIATAEAPNPSDIASTGDPTMAVQKWAGLNNAECSELVQMNDELHIPFDEIADHIEARL